jgi:glycerophosphoryl diester phosphodiesterase
VDSLLRPPIGFAHRGARVNAPENTIEAFRVALTLGAPGLESDVWLTADGVAVLDHEGVVRSGVRRRTIAALERRQLPSHIPSLEDLYRECGVDFQLSLDVKDDAAASVVVAVAAAAGDDALARLWLCHPDWEELARWRSEGTPDRSGKGSLGGAGTAGRAGSAAKGPVGPGVRSPLPEQVRLVNSTRLRRIHEGPERRAANLADAGIDAVNMHATDWTAGLATLFHRFQRLAFGWDAQFERTLVTLLRLGCDAVYSDHVERMVAALQQTQA